MLLCTLAVRCRLGPLSRSRLAGKSGPPSKPFRAFPQELSCLDGFRLRHPQVGSGARCAPRPLRAGCHGDRKFRRKWCQSMSYRWSSTELGVLRRGSQCAGAVHTGEARTHRVTQKRGGFSSNLFIKNQAKLLDMARLSTDPKNETGATGALGFNYLLSFMQQENRTKDDVAKAAADPG